MIGTTKMTDEEIETMMRDLIEQHLADNTREAALDWLEKCAVAYRAIRVFDGGKRKRVKRQSCAS
jgi:hypothetical protein